MKPQKCIKNGFPVVVGVIIFCAFLWPVSAQRKSGDPNKFAVIINGAGGEEVYAKQFEEWTRQLSSVLSDRFGFDTKHVTTLKNATADQVKATFGTLKSDLDANNVLFVFLIGHGSFDGKESKFNLVGPDIPATEYNALLSALPTRRVGSAESSALYSVAGMSGPTRLNFDSLPSNVP